MPAGPSVTYWAISVLNSRTMWFNAASFLVAVLSLTDVLTIIPPARLPLVTAITAAINLYLRTATQRPVAFIASGTSTPVVMPKIDPPPPGSAA
jgi:hypothetical protein